MLMTRNLAFLIASGALLFTSCTKENLDEPTNLVVLEGFVYAGQPVEHIKLSKMVAFGGTDTIPKPINDAVVRIYWNEVAYSLVENGGDSGFYKYPNTDLQILEGNSYRIEVDYFGTTAKATTTVPGQPQSLTVSKDTLAVPKFSLGPIFDTSAVQDLEDSIVLSWTADPEEYFYVVINNIESDPEQIVPEFLVNILKAFGVFSRPFQGDSYTIQGLDLTHFGDHKYTVYKVNKEYVDLFSTLDQDSRTLNEPETNVVGGLGVFSSFNGSTGLFHVKKP